MQGYQKKRLRFGFGRHYCGDQADCRHCYSFYCSQGTNCLQVTSPKTILSAAMLSLKDKKVNLLTESGLFG